ncbi:hypothetical protein HZC30_03335 [Candidatus Woesearchaeota archaeon]|nr:hypothetical protein [Candidatus Woesearchaeota archaeon]
MSRDQHPLEKYVKHALNVGSLGITLHRTCRVPEGKMNSLPASLGHFPVYKVADFHSGCPENWNREGSFFPMYRQEAMWVGFGHPASPLALVIGAGNINAVSGKPFDRTKDKFASEEERKAAKEGLEIKLEKAQNYLIVPPQPWLDGWKAEDGKIYQFVAAEMGSGETVEGQITGEETVGGIQFIVYNPKEGIKLVHATRPREYVSGGVPCAGGMGFIEEACYSPVRYRGAGSMGFSVKSLGGPAIRRAAQSMGLGRGGEIEQKIYPDPYGPEGSQQWKESPLEVWCEEPKAVEVFYMVSSEDFKQVTGHDAPPTPVTYEEYQKRGLLWFDLHDQKYGDSKGSDVFSKLKPVGKGKAPKDPFDKLKPVVKDEPGNKEGA